MRAGIRWQGPALALVGFALLAGALALGGGPELLLWNLEGLARMPLQVVALLGLFVAPGLALLDLLWPRERPLTLAARLALAPGLSAALPPLLLLLFQHLGLPWGRGATWAYLSISLALGARWWIGDWARLRSEDGGPPSTEVSGAAGLALLGICATTLLVRLFTVQGLPTGLLGDSYHHTLVTQLLIDRRGLFSSWQPYAPLATFTYHFGFHANAAFVHWISGVGSVRSVLWTGQILNAATVPLAFALVVALGGRPWAGVWAALITGFVSALPAWFVFWGRYTQLSGQVVLAVVVICWVALVESHYTLYQPGFTRKTNRKERKETGTAGFRSSSRWMLEGRSESLLPVTIGSPRSWGLSWRAIALAALVTAAQVLTHYLVTIFAALFVGSYLLVFVLARRTRQGLAPLALRAGLALLLALLLAGPWLLNTLSGTLARNASGFVNGAVKAQRIAEYASLPAVAPLYARGYLIVAALVGLGVAGWRRQWRMALPGLWAILLVLCVVPQVVGLPGTGIVDYLTAFSALYLALAPLAGYTLAALQEQGAALLARIRAPAPLGPALVWLAILAVVIGGTPWQLRIVDGSTQLVTDADMEAMAWIRANTPPDARFLVNSFPTYGGTLLAGTDAGWWLPLLAGRAAVLPPVNYGGERSESPRYVYTLHTLAATLRGRPLTDLQPTRVDLTTPEARRALRDAGIGYVYSGAHPSPGPDSADRIDTARLRASPTFRLLYEQGGVEIFQFVETGTE